VEEIVALHAPIHASIHSDSTLGNELIDVAALGDDAAVRPKPFPGDPQRRGARA
jgi:hypothetical protein